MGFPLFQRGKAEKGQANADTLAALSKSQAFIEFEPDGTIITANENFLGLMGYALAEVQGRHHSMFLEPSYAASSDYKDFWAKLARGEFQQALFKRIGKGGSEVWIEASYNPLLGKDGKVYRIVKVASDVTERHNQSADARGSCPSAWCN